MFDFLPSNFLDKVPEIETADQSDRIDVSLNTLVPENSNQAYDMKELIYKIIDEGNFFELKPFIEMGERFKAPRMLWANNKKEICFSDSFEVCVRTYENIMKLDESKFQYWQP